MSQLAVVEAVGVGQKKRVAKNTNRIEAPGIGWVHFDDYETFPETIGKQFGSNWIDELRNELAYRADINSVENNNREISWI